MKKSICTIIMALMALLTIAQTQKGYVKTKGRLAANGTVISGTRLAGTIIQVKGRNTVLSRTDGNFSFPMPGQQFQLQSVQKDDYVLIDPDVLSHPYSYSKSPLVLVMEDKKQQAAERRAIERRVKNNMYAQLEKREREIEALKEQNRISEQKYEELMQQLNDDEQQNESIVKEMVEAYTRMDFDLIDEFHRQVSNFILNGELDKADSLINTRGDIRTRVDQQLEKQKVLAAQQRKLDKAREMLAKDNDELAQLCYNKYQIFKLQHENDSAAHYLLLRTELDSTNVSWLLAAGDFLYEYKSDASESVRYYEKALSVAKDSVDFRDVYSCIGAWHSYQGDYKKAIEYHKKALSYFSEKELNTSPDMTVVYSNLATAYKDGHDFEKAHKYSHQSLELSLKLFGDLHENTAQSYHVEALIYYKMENFEKALECGKKEEKIYLNLPGDYDFELAACYNNLATDYKGLGQYEEAKTYYEKAVEMRKKILGEHHPNLAVTYNNLGNLFQEMGKNQEALDYFEKAIALWSERKATRRRLIDGYGNLAVFYGRLGNKVKALEMFEKGEKITEEFYEAGDNDGMIFLNYIYSTLGEMAETSEEYRQRYEHYLDDKAAVGLVPNIKSLPTVQRGMSGFYYILKYGDWDIDSSEDFFDKVVSMKGKPADLLFYKNGEVREEHFDGMIGCTWRYYYVTPEEKQAIRNAYEQWKKTKKTKR